MIEDDVVWNSLYDSTQGVTWWLEMVKIVEKDFEVLNKGEGQAMA